MLTKASNFTRNLAQRQLSHMKAVVGSGARNSRSFVAPTQELMDNLKALGITNHRVEHNPT